MSLPGRRFTGSINYRYGFNGKEEDDEAKGDGNQQDYGMRVYDPRLGRFLSVDPLAKEYPHYTPYSFAGNKPIWALDLDGLEELWYELVWDKGGKTVLGVQFCNENQNRGGFDYSTTYNMSYRGTHINAKTTVEFSLFDRHPGSYKTLYDLEKAFIGKTRDQIETLYNSQHRVDVQAWANVASLVGQTVSEGHGESIVASATSDAAFSNNVTEQIPTSVGVINNKNTAAHGNSEAADANAANKTQVNVPKEAYNRTKHYGKTPTASDRKALKATEGQDVDHTLPLVRHYYDGDGSGGIPGWQMSELQRKLWAKNRANMNVMPRGKNRSEGGKLTEYFKQKKKEYNLKSTKKTKS